MKNAGLQEMVDEIALFIRYGVPESKIETANSVLRRYRKSDMVLRLLREYYSSLPEAREEAVEKITRLIDSQGVYLFVLSTERNSYLYALSPDAVVLVGEYRCEIPGEMLEYFGIESEAKYLEMCVDVEQLAEYDESREVNKQSCPACGVLEGTLHLLGCAVEICPWCDGQLSNCNCRFEQLQTEEIETDEQIESFADRLSAKGRIPFKRNQLPLYPGTSAGLDKG